MDDLALRLKDLDPSEIEKYLALLQSLKAKQEDATTADVASSAPKSAPASSDPALPSAALETGAPPMTETAPAVIASPDSAALPPEEVPFAFGEFGIQTLTAEETAAEKGETKKPHRRKGLTSSAAKEKTDSSGDGASQLDGVAGPKPERPSQPAPQGLASFGFFATAPKTVDTTKNNHRLFSSFVPDKRIVPRALDFWSKQEGAKPGPSSSPAEEKTVEPDVCEAAPPVTGPKKSIVSFGEWVDTHHSGKTDLADGEGELDKNLTKRYSNVPEPYKGFNRETIYIGFFAIGYDPCQARPAYFGTHNNLQDGGVNGNELRQIGRFPLAGEMPRLSVLDYDYDSGDDWDALDGGEDVCMSGSSDTAGDADTFASSDLDFVASDDEDEGADSESELQHKIMEARQQRLRRLRGKEKLISSHTGPFVGVLPSEHPLRMWDRLDRLRSFADEALAEVLSDEMAARTSGTSTIEEMAAGTLSPHQGGVVEAGLKNRRSMSEEEIMAMHGLIEQNRMIGAKAIVQGFREKQLCIGVPRAEIERTVKRFYERKHGSLMAREEPWVASDPRLFAKPVKKSSQSKETPTGSPGTATDPVQTTLSVATPTTEKNENEEERGHSDSDADDEADDDDGSSAERGDGAPAAEGVAESQHHCQTAADANPGPLVPLPASPGNEMIPKHPSQEDEEPQCTPGTKRPRDEGEGNGECGPIRGVEGTSRQPPLVGETQ